MKRTRNPYINDTNIEPRYSKDICYWNMCVLLVGQMDQNMNLKEKWVYEEKVSSYKKWLQIIYNSYM